MKRIVFVLYLFLINTAYSQNLVSNGSFEQFSRCPLGLGEFYPINWYSIANNSTPDLYSYCAWKNGTAHPSWYYSGVKPFKDSSYVGMIVDDKKSTYRECLGTKLKSKLREDSVYIVEISVAVPKMSRYTIQSLDVIFSKSTIYSSDGYSIIQRVPSFSIDLDSIKTDGTWTSFSFEYTANGNEAHMSIGNFKSKKETVLSKIKDRNDFNHKKVYNSAYLCIDGVSIHSLNEPSLAQSKSKIRKREITQSPFVVNGIQFRSGSALIENESVFELDEIARIMLENRELTIEITGHTDDSGNEDENIHLSFQRALNVKSYLIDLGISNSRIKTEGKGSQYPIGDNNTEDGKLKNRRIEVVIH